jgi:S-adenosylmethionine:tRNA ribosyltransferase-isomerase
MKPATTSKRLLEEAKLLVLSPKAKIIHEKMGALGDFLNPGDLLVVNRSATLPSSFRGYLKRTGEFIEIRLAAFQGTNPSQLDNWLGISFGLGDWRIPTEKRGVPPTVVRGDQIILGKDLMAEVTHIEDQRILGIKFISSSLQENLYKYGKPIQYSYLKEELEVWDQQTIFSGPPISVEPPSASFQFTWKLIFQLQKKGVRLAHLLHGAGLSSTGDSYLNSLLPLKEWYEVPRETVDMINTTKRKGHRVIAFGTSVLRALESARQKEELVAGSGKTTLKITPGYKFHHVDGLITGMHELGTSHMEILNAFCPTHLIKKAYKEAIEKAYRGHEYGDISLLQGRMYEAS